VIHISRILLEPFPRHSIWRSYKSAMLKWDDDRKMLLIPGGTYSDLATIPNEVWPLLATDPNQTALAGFVHDYTVRWDAFLVEAERVKPISFDESLIVTNLVLEDSGVDGFDRWKIITALKVAKPIYWHKKSVNWVPEGLA